MPGYADKCVLTVTPEWKLHSSKVAISPFFFFLFQMEASPCIRCLQSRVKEYE